MSTKTRISTPSEEETRHRSRVEQSFTVSRSYALSQAAQILLSNNIVSESKVLEAYHILVREQRKGNINYPVDYEFVLEAIKFARKLKRLREKK